ncbi:MAG: hypothetical protein HYU39_06390 [Thaumarchaeota archaeon]|nr:hypothetical protein [Nitrososphaerota archaeon]
MPQFSASKKVQSGNRTFNIYAAKFSNGCFLSLSEGEADRIGAIFLSVKTIDKIDSVTVVPGKFGQVFSNMLSQLVARITNGIAVASLYIASELDEHTMKMLIGEVKELLSAQPAIIKKP